MVKHGNFIFLLLALILAYQLEDLLPQKRHLVVKNGNFIFLLLELILADQLADLSPGIGMSWSRIVILHFYF